MVHSQFSLSWDSYKSNICSGFSALQQNGEFVDMTIAADGHFVKVHQMLVALASPYLKELITSAPCQHPVIFLNNVSHRVLCLLLEYIYTGEVVVPADCLSSFAETAKSLHIRGLESIGNSSTLPVKMSVAMPNLEETCHLSAPKQLIVPVSNKLDEINLPGNAAKIFIKRDTSRTSQTASNTSAPRDEMQDYPDLMDDTNTQDSDEMFKIEDCSNKDMNSSVDKPSSKLQFTVSIRGSLQVILNRYIYNLHSTTRFGLRRWRCVDYRNNKCSAYVTTRGNVVLNRANLHNHAFHDKKILSKIEKKVIYSAIEEAECYKEKEIKKDATKSSEENEISMENDSFISLEGFGDNIDVKANNTINVKET